MKNLLCFFVIAFVSNIAIGQTIITVTNNTNCDVWFEALAKDASNMVPCVYSLSSQTAVPANSGPTNYSIGSFSWSPSAPTYGTGLEINAFHVDFDLSTGCSSAVGYDVGNPNCGGYSNNVAFAPCSCSTGPVSAYWTQTGPLTWTLVFN